MISLFLWLHNIFRVEILYYCVNSPTNGYCRLNIYVPAPPPPNSCVEILLLDVLVFGDGIIGRGLGHRWSPQG